MVYLITLIRKCTGSSIRVEIELPYGISDQEFNRLLRQEEENLPGFYVAYVSMVAY